MRHNPGHPRLIVGISGASGAIYGARLLELKEIGHLYPTEAPDVDETIAAFLQAHS